MSEFGPAFFISRKDHQPIPKQEQAQLLGSVAALCKKHGIVSDMGEPVIPKLYGYNKYEKDAVSFLIYSSSSYAMMPQEAQDDQLAADQEELRKVEKDLSAACPGVYDCKCYYVEN